LSVAATKSFSASLAALLRLIARWGSDEVMEQALARLPDRLAQASTLDWSEALGPLARSSNVIVIGRGPTLAPAREAALKLKETCELHGEAFSAAEFRHGPIALVSDAYPVLAFRPNDETATTVSDLVADLRRKGITAFVTEEGEGHPGRLPTLIPDHPDADAICLIQSFYAFIVDLAIRRGTHIHQPRHLKKVTRTR
jgi:glutamine---fructose-6-phosphate transaminase (isomerizing)